MFQSCPVKIFRQRIFTKTLKEGTTGNALVYYCDTLVYYCDTLGYHYDTLGYYWDTLGYYESDKVDV